MGDRVPFVGSDGEKLTISSYIECLQQALETFGDLPVVVSCFDDWDPYCKDLYCPGDLGHSASRIPVVSGYMGPYRQAEDDDNEDREFVIHLGQPPLCKE